MRGSWLRKSGEAVPENDIIKQGLRLLLVISFNVVGKDQT